MILKMIFWINNHLRNHITFEHPNNSPRVHFVWKMILNQRPAEKAYYIWTPIQYPSCAFCVENDFENDILNQQSPEEPYYIWAPKQFPSCAFCLENDFESMISWGTMLHLSTKSIHTTPLSPSFSFTSWFSLFSLLSFPQEFGSCMLCGEDFSIDSWLKMHIISKHQTNSQHLSLSPSSLFTSGVCSASVPSGTSGGSGLATYEKKHK